MAEVYGFDRATVQKLKRDHLRLQAQINNLRSTVDTQRSKPRWFLKRLRFRNDSDESIPAYGVMKVTGTTTHLGKPVVTVNKPDATFSNIYLLNGANTIAVGGQGFTQSAADVILAAYDAGTPASGEGWGAKPGQWTLAKGYPGARIVGVYNATKKHAQIERVPMTAVVAKSLGLIGPASSDTPTTGTFEVSYFDGASYAASGMFIAGVHNISRETWINSGVLYQLVYSDGAWVAHPDPEENIDRVWHGTAIDDITHGATATVQRTGSTQVEATNWSDHSDIRAGDKLVIWRDPTDENYYTIRAGGARVLQGLLNEDLDASDPDVDIFGPTDLIDGSDPGDAGTIDNLGLSGKNGDKCLFVESPITTNGYQLIQVEHQQPPRWFKATLNADLSNAAGTTGVTTTAALDGAGHPGSITAKNSYSLSGKMGVEGLVVEDRSGVSTEYLLVQLDHIAVTAVTDVDWNDPNLRKKTQQMTTLWQAAESDWENYLTADEIDAVIDVDVSGVTLRKNQQTIRVLGSDAAGGLTVYHTGGDCVS